MKGIIFKGMSASVKKIRTLFVIAFVMVSGFLSGQIDLSLSHLKASPLGGKSEFKRIVAQEMIYPASALENKKEGVVTLCFAVTTDSVVHELKVAESAGEELDQEALRIFKKVLWFPAYYQGEPIATINCVKIPFLIKEYLKVVKKRGYTRIADSLEYANDDNNVYDYFRVEKSPKPLFTAKNMNLAGFLASEIKYPPTAIKNNISGTVKVRFVVEPNGMITNIHAIEKVSGGCTEETIRAVKLIRWKAGTYKGKYVRTWVEITLKYHLPGDGQYQIIPVLAKGLLN